MRTRATIAAVGLLCGCTSDPIATTDSASASSTSTSTGSSSGEATTTTTGVTPTTTGSGSESLTGSSTEQVTSDPTTTSSTTSTGTSTTSDSTTSTGTSTTSDSSTSTTSDSTTSTGTTSDSTTSTTSDSSTSTTGDPVLCGPPGDDPGGVIHFGGLGGEQTLGFAVDGLGARYSGGVFFGPSVDLAPGGGAVLPAQGQGGNMWLNKIDADGKYAYGYTWPTLDGYHCYVWSFAPDVDGSVYVVGHFVGVLDLDPGPGVDLHTAGNGAGDLAGFLIKLDPAGAYQWGRSWSGGELMTAFGLAMAGDGALYVTGYFSGDADLDPGPGEAMFSASGIGNATDAYLTKFDHDGNFLWARTWGAGGELYGFHVAVDADGNAFATGTTGGPADLDPGPGMQLHTAQGLGDTYVARFLADGTWDWAFAIGGASFDQFNAITVDPDGRVWLAGGFASPSIDVDPGPGETLFTLQGQGYDGMVVRYTAAGDLDLSLQLGGAGHDNLWGIAADCEGDTYVAGHFSGTVDLDPGPGVAMHVSGGESDPFLLAIDAAGTHRWSKHWPNTSYGGTQGVAVGPDRRVHAQISYDGPIDGDAGPGELLLPDNGDGDVLLQVLSHAGGDW